MCRQIPVLPELHPGDIVTMDNFGSQKGPEDQASDGVNA